VHNRARDNQTSASFLKGQIGATAEVVWETSFLRTVKQKETKKENNSWRESEQGKGINSINNKPKWKTR